MCFLGYKLYSICVSYTAKLHLFFLPLQIQLHLVFMSQKSAITSKLRNTNKSKVFGTVNLSETCMLETQQLSATFEDIEMYCKMVVRGNKRVCNFDLDQTLIGFFHNLLKNKI